MRDKVLGRRGKGGVGGSVFLLEVALFCFILMSGCQKCGHYLRHVCLCLSVSHWTHQRGMQASLWDSCNSDGEK
jgi:hypothetical protein